MIQSVILILYSELFNHVALICIWSSTRSQENTDGTSNQSQVIMQVYLEFGRQVEATVPHEIETELAPSGF